MAEKAAKPRTTNMKVAKWHMVTFNFFQHFLGEIRRRREYFARLFRGQNRREDTGPIGGGGGGGGTDVKRVIAAAADDVERERRPGSEEKGRKLTFLLLE